MLKKVYDVKVIGASLALLYATSLYFVAKFSHMDAGAMPFRAYFYTFVFSALLVSAFAVMNLQEWGRKTILALNGIMFACLLAHYIPKIDMVPLAYIFMNVIVLLYFSQTNIRQYFHGKKFKQWRSILVIDDDEMLLKMVRPVLMAHGCSVLTATTGEEGLQILKTQKPDLVVLDVLLPKMKGRDVCRAIKRDPVTKDLPVVFLTAKDSAEDIEAEKEVGGTAHLTKPFHAGKLIKTVRDILEPEHA